jgi:hypothetical protein
MEASVAKSIPDNNIPPGTVSVEESQPVDWDNIAIAVPHDMKTAIIVAARNDRLTMSEWGRKVLVAALARKGGGVRAVAAESERRQEDRRRA